LSNLACWCVIAYFWDLILGKSGPKPDFGSRISEIRPFLTVIILQKPNRAEIVPQKAVKSADKLTMIVTKFFSRCKRKDSTKESVSSLFVLRFT